MRGRESRVIGQALGTTTKQVKCVPGTSFFKKNDFLKNEDNQIRCSLVFIESTRFVRRRNELDGSSLHIPNVSLASHEIC